MKEKKGNFKKIIEFNLHFSIANNIKIGKLMFV